MSLFYRKSEDYQEIDTVNSVNVVIAGVLLVVAVLMLALFGGTTFGRYQKRQNAMNNIRVTELEIQNTEQKVEVEKQKAEVRVAKANGISQAQHIINATLTDQYLQHEAIEAQRAMASSPNHTTIYIPSGQNGIPIINTIDPQARQ